MMRRVILKWQIVASRIIVVNKQRNALIDEIDEFLDEARRLLRWIRSAFALIFCNRPEIWY